LLRWSCPGSSNSRPSFLRFCFEPPGPVMAKVFFGDFFSYLQVSLTPFSLGRSRPPDGLCNHVCPCAGVSVPPLDRLPPISSSEDPWGAWLSTLAFPPSSSREHLRSLFPQFFPKPRWPIWRFSSWYQFFFIAGSPHLTDICQCQFVFTAGPNRINFLFCPILFPLLPFPNPTPLPNYWDP